MMKVSEFVPGMDHMDVWEIIDRVNLSQMTGKPLADNEKEQMADFLLQQAAFGKTENRAVSAGKKNMYPIYFVPDDTQKRRLFPGILPKTKLLYRNFYELEALRVLIKLSPSVRGTEPVTKTLERLRSTCFETFVPSVNVLPLRFVHFVFCWQPVRRIRNGSIGCCSLWCSVSVIFTAKRQSSRACRSPI